MDFDLIKRTVEDAGPYGFGKYFLFRLSVVYHFNKNTKSFARSATSLGVSPHHLCRRHIIICTKCNIIGRKPTSFAPSGATKTKAVSLETALCFIIAYCAASTIAANFSGMRDAPPIRPPSTLGLARSSDAFLSFIEPPYWMVTLSATSSP